MTVDHRKGPRRRGDALNDAIFQATIDELIAVGYTGLTIDRVADRARASKASIYRRWPNRVDLVLAAVNHFAPERITPPDTGTFRGDVLALARRTASLLNGPAGEALRAIVSDAASLAELRGTSQGTGRRAMSEIARRAAARGDIDPSVVTNRRLDALQAMIRQSYLFDLDPLTDAVVVEIVDEVVLPLFGQTAARSPTHWVH